MSAIANRLGSVRSAIIGGGQRVLGHPSRLSDRLLRLVLVLSAMGIVAAVWTFIIQGVSPQRSSYGTVAPLVRFATSTWSYLIIELLLLRSILYVSDSRKAQQAASHLGMTKEGVSRLAAEAKSTDGATRVISTSADSEEEISERIRSALQQDEREPDVLRRESAPDTEEVISSAREQLLARRRELRAEYDECIGQVEESLSEALSSDMEIPKSGAFESHLVSLSELMDTAAEESLTEAEELLERSEELETQLQETQHNLAMVRRYDSEHLLQDMLQEGASDAERLSAALEDAGFPVSDTTEEDLSLDVDVELPSLWRYLRPGLLAGAVITVFAGLWSYLPDILLGMRSVIPDSLKSHVPYEERATLLESLRWLADADIIIPALGVVMLILVISLGLYYRKRRKVIVEARREAFHGDARVPIDTDEKERELTWSESFKLWRMDAAATIETGDLLWRFAAPALLTFVALVITAGIWLRWWVYPLLLCGGIFVGALNYARIRGQQNRQLSRLREDSDFEAWDACSLQVKGPITVETTQMCFAWFNGSLYAHPRSEVLADELAPRVRDLLEGRSPAPSVLAKYGRNIRDYYPDTEAWRRNVEEYQIARELVDQVRSAPNGILPLPMLIEDTVLSDKESKLWGLIETGEGYDPALVRKVYLELSCCSESDETAHLLVEEGMEVETAHGETETVTAVRLRTDPLPADVSEVRAAFSNRFRAYAQFDPLYRLPSVEEPEAEPLNPHPPEPDSPELSITESVVESDSAALDERLGWAPGGGA